MSHKYATGSKEGENGVCKDLQYLSSVFFEILSHARPYNWGMGLTNLHAWLLRHSHEPDTAETYAIFLFNERTKLYSYGVQEEQCEEDTSSFAST